MSVPSVYEITALIEERTTPSLKTQLPTMTLNSAVLAAIFSAAAVGTGGVVNPHALGIQTFTGPVARACSVHASQNEEERLLDTQEKIAAIRRYLSLNMTDLAKVLNVGRPTVYSWATTPVTLHSSHRKRIDVVYEIARNWRALSSDPMGRLVREPFANGITVIDLLSTDKLDAAAIRNGMLQVRDLQGGMQRRLTVAEAAEKAGVRLASRRRRNWRSSGELDVQAETVG
jgi:DNA-binding transcriptional regulator YiaG